MNSDLLKILRCPETHQELRPAEAALIEKLIHQIAAGQLQDRNGRPVQERIDAGLVREDQTFLYPIRHNIPVMLIEESIPLTKTKS